MKALVYGLFLILVAESAWAIEARRSPQYICSLIDSDAERSACYQLVSKGGSFNGLALGVCEHRTKSAKDILECVDIVQGGKFQSEVAIWACDRMEDPSDAVGCLGAIRSDPMDDGAVLACSSRIDDQDDLMECLDTIIDKTYQYAEIAECKNKPTTAEIIDCFEARGEDGPREKARKKAGEEWDRWFKSGGKAQSQSQSQAKPKIGLMATLDAFKKDPNLISRCIQQQQSDNSDVEQKLKNLGVPLYVGKFVPKN